MDVSTVVQPCLTGSDLRGTLRILGILLLVGWLGLGSARAEATPGSASATVRDFYATLLVVMKNAAALGPRGRYEKLEPVVRRCFDVPFMTRMSVGVAWGHLSPEQKQRAWHAFGRYITAVYASEFDGYSGEQFKVLNELKIRHGVLVRTQLVKSDGEPVSMNYVVHDNDIAWQIRDIFLSGTISELATRRSEFAAILRTKGIDGLIATLNQKADQLV